VLVFDVPVALKNRNLPDISGKGTTDLFLLNLDHANTSGALIRNDPEHYC